MSECAIAIAVVMLALVLFAIWAAHYSWAMDRAIAEMMGALKKASAGEFEAAKRQRAYGLRLRRWASGWPFRGWRMPGP